MVYILLTNKISSAQLNGSLQPGAFGIVQECPLIEKNTYKLCKNVPDHSFLCSAKVPDTTETECLFTDLQEIDMKLIFLSLITLFLHSGLFGQENNDEPVTEVPLFEAGVLLGEPVGISIKYWYSKISAADLGAAWSFTENGIFEIFADYLIHFLHIETDYGLFPIFTGPGLTLRIGNDWFFGAQLPVGTEWIIKTIPFTITAEIIPQWQLIPENKFVMAGGLALRLRFGTVR